MEVANICFSLPESHHLKIHFTNSKSAPKPSAELVTVAVLYSFLQDSSSLLTHSQPNFFSFSHTFKPTWPLSTGGGSWQVCKAKCAAGLHAGRWADFHHTLKLSQPAYQPGRPPPLPPPKKRLPLHCSALLNWLDFGWPAPTEALRDVVMSHQKEEVR